MEFLVMPQASFSPILSDNSDCVLTCYDHTCTCDTGSSLICNHTCDYAPCSHCNRGPCVTHGCIPYQTINSVPSVASK